MKTFVSIFLTLTLSVIATAGLDNAGRFDDVVAIYRFENISDSGPRNFTGILTDGASIVNNGKIGKCVKIQNIGAFGTINDQHLGIVNREFSIVAWVKMRKQTKPFHLALTALNDDETYEGFIDLSVESSGNISGFQTDVKNNKSVLLESQNLNVADNIWHHIAFTKYAHTLTLFVDGEAVKTQRSTDYLGFVGDSTFILVGGSSKVNLTGSVYVDELGFFETGFSIYEIKGIYNDGLTRFLEAMPVDPQEKTATTWGALKQDKTFLPSP